MREWYLLHLDLSESILCQKSLYDEHIPTKPVVDFFSKKFIEGSRSKQKIFPEALMFSWLTLFARSKTFRVENS
jgi:hypothetical protein